MRLETSDAPAGKKIDHIRLDCIASTAPGLELWWVARAFDDESTQPEGMFPDRGEADNLAQELSRSLGVPVVVTHFEDKT